MKLTFAQPIRPCPPRPISSHFDISTCPGQKGCHPHETQDAGNSSSYPRQSLEEIHSEEWGRRALQYLSDCELHKRGSRLVTTVTVYRPPPAYRPVPLAQWFETAHGNEIVQHVQEMQGVITSTYGRILKLDSTKKITKKLAGGIDGTAAWMSNVGNEYGAILNSVLTTGEGAGLKEMCQGIVKRYKDAGEPEPIIQRLLRFLQPHNWSILDHMTCAKSTIERHHSPAVQFRLILSHHCTLTSLTMYKVYCELSDVRVMVRKDETKLHSA